MQRGGEILHTFAPEKLHRIGPKRLRTWRLGRVAARRWDGVERFPTVEGFHGESWTGSPFRGKNIKVIAMVSGGLWRSGGLFSEVGPWRPEPACPPAGGAAATRPWKQVRGWPNFFP